MEKSAALFRPKLIVAGASAYSRLYDYARVRKVAVQVTNSSLLSFKVKSVWHWYEIRCTDTVHTVVQVIPTVNKANELRRNVNVMWRRFSGTLMDCNLMEYRFVTSRRLSCLLIWHISVGWWQPVWFHHPLNLQMWWPPPHTNLFEAHVELWFSSAKGWRRLQRRVKR